MAFNIRTRAVIQQTDGIYVVTYEAFDDEDDTVSPKVFQVQGTTKQMITVAVAAKIVKLKATYEKQSMLLALSDEIIQDLHDQYVLGSPSPTPSNSPSATPSATPSGSPSSTPSATPSEGTPSSSPSGSPSGSPSATPSTSPSASPSGSS